MPGGLRRAAASRGGRPVLVVLALLLAGVAGGVVWQLLWTPPTGVALGGEFVLDGTGVRDAFDGTALFVVVAGTIGVVAGLLIGWVTRRDELAVLAVSVLGAIAATAVMYLVGHALGPADPAVAAADAEDYTRLRDQLTLSGRAPWLMMVGGLLVGLIVTLLGVAGRGGPPGGPDEGAGPAAVPDDGPEAGDRRLDWRSSPR